MNGGPVSQWLPTLLHAKASILQVTEGKFDESMNIMHRAVKAYRALGMDDEADQNDELLKECGFYGAKEENGKKAWAGRLFSLALGKGKQKKIAIGVVGSLLVSCVAYALYKARD